MVGKGSANAGLFFFAVCAGLCRGPAGAAGQTALRAVSAVCDCCGGKLVIRKDDQPATVLDRLNAYHEQTEPLVEFYRTRGKLAAIPFCPSIEETTAEIMKALEA